MSQIYKIYKVGKGNISAKIIADSISPSSKRITTFELEYPRFIHAELLTHRLFSRNSASTRAIPTERMIDLIESMPAMPIHWGKNNPGMQSHEELDIQQKQSAQELWMTALKNAISIAKIMSDKNGINGHKQWVGRILEPFAMMKVVLTATEFANFWNLRDHNDAQPEIRELARVMREAYNNSIPVRLEPGQWHMPYVETRFDDKEQTFWSGEKQLTLEQALKVSVSCCAQVSYRKLDDTLEKAEKIFSKLHLNDDSNLPAHASPTEHQATPMKFINASDYKSAEYWEKGVTHADRSGQLWSGNLCGWIQYRKLIPKEAVW